LEPPEIASWIISTFRRLSFADASFSLLLALDDRLVGARAIGDWLLLRTACCMPA
jgi:hypothetical protein